MAENAVVAKHYDVLIVGGGMVGASLAHALAATDLHIGVIEAHPADSDSQPSYDDRVIALSWGSRLILEGMGTWSSIAPDAQPIDHIHISDRGHFGFAHLDAKDEGVEALGYVVTARALGRGLLANLAPHKNVDLICPARLLSFDIEDAAVTVTIDVDGQSQEITSRLLVAADGGNSVVRNQLAIKMREWEYGQSAIISNITTERPHNNIAYERFTDSGPLAMLPMTEGRCSLVWTAKTDQVEDILSWDEAAFLRHLQTRFGGRLGRMMKAGKRFAYPLKMSRAKEQVRPRMVLIGNAAHTVHPVAGQGFNLGIRDVAVLADVLAEAAKMNADPGSIDVLERYAKWRESDQHSVTLMTDGLVRLFSNPLMPLRVARDVGLLGLDMIPGFKRQAARQFMGLNGRLPRLSRGLPLVR